MNKIPVVLGSDNKIFFTVATVLVSIAENAKKDTFYEIYIMCAADVTQNNKQTVKNLENKYKNIAINFIDMGDTFVDIPKTHTYVNYVSAYKMKIPSLLSQYDKVLYLDTDVIVRTDLSELFATDIHDNYIAGVPAMMNQINNRDNIQNIIGVDMDYYVNAGVLLFNNKLILKDKIDEKCISMLGAFEGSVDQHIFNYVCYGRIGFLPLKYNVFLADYYLYEKIGNIFTSIGEAIEAKNNPVIMHFTRKEKPWNYYDLPFSHEWFRYYIKTGFSPLQRVKLTNNSICCVEQQCREASSNMITRYHVLGIPFLKIVKQDNIWRYYLFGLKIMSSKRK